MPVGIGASRKHAYAPKRDRLRPNEPGVISMVEHATNYFSSTASLTGTSQRLDKVPVVRNCDRILDPCVRGQSVELC